MTSNGNGAQRTECLDEFALAELAEGRSAPAERASRIAHVAACDHCREQLSSLVELLADESIAAEIATPSPVAMPARSYRWVRAVPLVAAAILVALTLPRYVRSTHVPTVERDSDTFGSAPVPLAPVGDVSNARELRWSAVSGADLYQVRLYDARSRVLFETSVERTSVVLPDSVTIVPGASYLWKVAARTSIGRWEGRDLTEFRVTPRSP